MLQKDKKFVKDMKSIIKPNDETIIENKTGKEDPLKKD